MSDLTRYFRIEARELVDELTRTLSELARGGPAAGPAGAALRQAHTLKGAARVVGRADLADRVHSLEEQLGAFRNATGPVPVEDLDRMQALVDGLSVLVDDLPQDIPGGPGEPSGQPDDLLTDRHSGRPLSPGPPVPPPLHPPPAGRPDPALRVPAPRSRCDATAPAPSVPLVPSGPLVPPVPGVASGPLVPPVPADRHPSSGALVPAAPVSTSAGFVPPPRQSPEAAGTTPATAARTTRASLAEIDSLIDGVSQTRGQLRPVRHVALRARRIRDTAAGARREHRPDGRMIGELTSLARILDASVDRIERDLREVYATAERLRLIPVETIVPDLERGVRDVATTLGKRARLEVRGAQIALDAMVLGSAQAALRQIVRNAVAHGVEAPEHRAQAGKDETGLVRLEITHTARGIRFSCRDDGQGIDLPQVRSKLVAAGHDPAKLTDARTLDLLLGSGISTAGTVSEVAGHGIGLDLVQDVMRRLGGRVEITTTAGTGTRIDLLVPGSMTAQEVVLVRAGRGTVAAHRSTPPTDPLLALPLRAIRQARRIGPQDFSEPGKVQHEDRRIPYVALAELIRPGSEEAAAVDRAARTVLLLDGADGPVAVGVGRLVGTAQIAVRPVPELAAVPPLVCGLWIDIDGLPRPVLDPVQVTVAAAAADLDAGTHPEGSAARGPGVARSAPLPVTGSTEPVRILIVDDSPTTRMLERSILQSAGYRIDEASSAEQGLEMATRTAYAVAVVDVEMPGMDGFGFVEQTRDRSELRQMPCILVTSKADEPDRARGRAAGARGHIDKAEFDQNTLLETVAQVLAAQTGEEPR